MGDVSGQSEFADYRAIGSGVAIVPSFSFVISLCPRSVTVSKSGIKELKWS